MIDERTTLLSVCCLLLAGGDAPAQELTGRVQEAARSDGLMPLRARVGVNAVPPYDSAHASDVLGIGWVRDYTIIGGSVDAEAGPVAYVPVLQYQSQADTPELLESFSQMIDAGALPVPEPLTKKDFLDQLSLERLRERIRDDPDAFPPGTLFQVGNEPGFRSASNHDHRTAEQIVADARILRTMLDEMERDYRLSLGGISTPEHDYFPDPGDAYGGFRPFEFWEEILRRCEPDLFAAFSIHPYPNDRLHPTIADLREQILTARRLLARHGFREKELIASETSILPLHELEEERALAYTGGAIEFYLTATDPEVGNPRDGDRLVQRFAWFILDAQHMPERHAELDMTKTSLLKPDGSLTPMGTTFRDTVQRFAGKAR